MTPRPLILALALAAACDRAGAPADLVAYGRVWTGDSAAPWAQAVATRGERIVYVGDSTGAARLVGERTRVVAGAFVAPGFGDAHVHFTDGGFQLQSVDLRPAQSKEEFIRRLGAYAKTRKPGEWILGGDWDHESWEGAPLPERSWIDSITPDNPVFVNRLDGHMALANSAALRLAGVSAETRDISGGVIVRDLAGVPTGILKDEAQVPVYNVMPPPTPEQMDSALVRASRWAASKGVTSVGSVSAGWDQVAALRRAHAAGRLGTRVSTYVPLSEWRAAAETLRVHGAGDEVLRVAGVKAYVDGSLGSTTALLERPYLDDPGSTGLLTTPRDSLASWVGRADSAGLQVAVHAIGDRANRIVLDIFDSVATAHGARDRRFRVEHAQHLRPADIARFGALGVIASMQPYHIADDGRWAWKRIGPELTRTTYPFRSLLDSGARLALGSDWTVAPIDPLLGLKAAITRQTLDGKNPGGWVPEEKISLDEALRAYTAGEAFANFGDEARGVLKVGRLADIVVLDQDLSAIPAETIDQVQVLATIMNGRVVFDRSMGH
ncbi:MAG TPA: amidohydrolase [Gemmatimonadales bacterium]|nr:amidohydrolase [Gemmatimonadales bacterium]